jgi:hypothetical protein
MAEPNNNPTLSRRKWIGLAATPAIAASVGSGILASTSRAADAEGAAAPDDTDLGSRIYNVRAFGAKGDGATLDSAAVQAAIDACTRDRGGIVLVPAGDFIVGTLELKSNVTLRIAAQGRLLGSENIEHYKAGNGIPRGNGNIVLLSAAEAENVTIEGPGTIDGNGAKFFTGQGDNTGPGQDSSAGYFNRPHLMVFHRCRNLVIRDVFLTASAYHCARILQCQSIRLEGVRIYNRVNKNNDGFHFSSCRYVHIANCDVTCQDDACALFGSNQFVTVTNCSFSTRWSIFRFGSGEAQNITVSNCIIHETYGCPIKISAGGRSRIENLTFSNLIMKNVTGPIGIGFSPGSGRRDENQEPPPKPFLRNIAFNGIRATLVPFPVNHPDIPFEVKPFDGERNSCITLNGMGEAWIENVSFNDVHVVSAGGGSAELAAKRSIPEISREYFGVWGEEPFGPPAYGIFARNVRGLTLTNVRFEVANPDLRPAAVFDHVVDATVNGFSAQGNPEAESVMRFIDCRDILLTASRVLTPGPVFLQVEGAGNEGITIDGGDLSKASATVAFKNGAEEKSVKVRG